MHLRASRNLKSEMSLQDPVGMDKEGNEVTLLEILAAVDESVDEIVENAEEKQLLLRALCVLGEKECYVLRCRYGLDGNEPKTQREVAKSLGISRSYVSRIEKKAIGKLVAELKRCAQL
jgi:RNA polymerase sporulation-specific sigma factor